LLPDERRTDDQQPFRRSAYTASIFAMRGNTSGEGDRRKNAHSAMIKPTTPNANRWWQMASRASALMLGFLVLY